MTDLRILDKPGEEPTDQARFVSALEEYDDIYVTCVRPVVYDTTCPQLDGSIARVRIAICPDEEAAKLVAVALNLLVRAQAASINMIQAGRERRQGGNGKGGLRQ